MNDGITFGAIISGFVVTWGWLFKISFRLGQIDQKVKDLFDNFRYGGETW